MMNETQIQVSGSVLKLIICLPLVISQSVRLEDVSPRRSCWPSGTGIDIWIHSSVVSFMLY